MRSVTAALWCAALSLLTVGFSESAMTHVELEAMARESLSALAQAGKDSQECKDLATEAAKTVVAQAEENQEMLDNLPDGSACAALVTPEGNPVIKEARDDLTKANNKLRENKKALSKAGTAPVKHGKMAFDSVTPGNCNPFFGKNYRSAKAQYRSAQQAVMNVQAEIKDFTKAHKTAIEDGEKQMHKCLCSAKRNRDKIWADFARNMDEQAVELKKAKMMLCVLSGKMSDSVECNPKLEPLKKKALIPAAEKVVCKKKTEAELFADLVESAVEA